MWKLIHDNYTKRFSSSTAANMISDVYDGVEYKRNIHLGEVGNISFIVNTDGVAIFRSFKKSLWPVWLVVNELPPAERYVCKTILVGWAWINFIMNVCFSRITFHTDFSYICLNCCSRASFV